MVQFRFICLCAAFLALYRPSHGAPCRCASVGPRTGIRTHCQMVYLAYPRIYVLQVFNRVRDGNFSLEGISPGWDLKDKTVGWVRLLDSLGPQMHACFLSTVDAYPKSILPSTDTQ